MMGGMMGGFGSSFGGSYGLQGGLIGLIFNVVILVGIVLLVVWAVKQFTSQRSVIGTPQLPTNNNSQSAREVLDTRYVKGEINRDEYQTMLNDIL